MMSQRSAINYKTQLSTFTSHGATIIGLALLGCKLLCVVQITALCVQAIPIMSARSALFLYQPYIPLSYAALDRLISRPRPIMMKKRHIEIVEKAQETS